MKKVVISLFFVVALILSSLNVAFADTTWKIEGDDESTILEQVFTNDEELAIFLNSAGFENDKATNSYYRQTENWETYNNLAEKFPINVNTKNFLIFSTTTVNVDNNQETNILRNTTSLVNLEFTTFGFYFKNSGEKIADYTSKWEFTSSTLGDFPDVYLTKYVTFNGFALGLSIFIIGVLAIAIVYFRMISRVDKLIADEYSIENYLAKQAKAEANIIDDEK